MSSIEKIIAANGVELCVRVDGDADDPAIVLIHGAGHSLLNWDDELCERLAAGSRFVVRYDSRDAGRSTSYGVGTPPYTLHDLAADAVGLLDGLGLETAHLVGMSQGAAVSQLVVLDHPGRVASLTLASSTPGGPGHWYDDLPPMSADLAAFFTAEPPAPDWTDRSAVVDYLVEVERPFAAHTRPFDEEGLRELAGRVADRATDIAAQVTNPYLLDAGEPWRDRLGTIGVPTLILHGTEDPLLPSGHGQALADEIPGARLIPMEHTGHEVFPRSVWDVVVPAVLEHTAR